MIELGRYQPDHISRENRLCPLCKSNQIENETHFLLDCSKYSSQRRTFLNRINELIPNFERKSTSESIKLLMNCNDYHVNKLVMKFISSCMNTAVSRKVVQLKSKKTYATIPKGMMGCGCSLLHRQVHEFSARWKAVL